MGKRQKQICMNHKDSVIFESSRDKCPVCKETDYTFSYSGDKSCNYNLNGTARQEAQEQPSIHAEPEQATPQPAQEGNPQNRPEQPPLITAPPDSRLPAS